MNNVTGIGLNDLKVKVLSDVTEEGEKERESERKRTMVPGARNEKFYVIPCCREGGTGPLGCE